MFERDWITCSKCANHSRFSSQHDWKDLYDHLITKRSLPLVMNKWFIWAPKIRGKWVLEQLGFTHHLALFACFFSSEKWVQREKYPNNTCLPCSFGHWMGSWVHDKHMSPRNLSCVTGNLYYIIGNFATLPVWFRVKLWLTSDYREGFTKQEHTPHPSNIKTWLSKFCYSLLKNKTKLGHYNIIMLQLVASTPGKWIAPDPLMMLSESDSILCMNFEFCEEKKS